MKNLTDFNSKIEFVLTDIDDTLTTEGQLPSASYDALWRLHDAGVKVVPITGRPAGWCEMIARFWPVEGIIGENGGFYFRYAAQTGEKQKKMQRWFFFNEQQMSTNRQKLQLIKDEVLQKVAGAAVSSDQFCRVMDLAIDFCEDVPRLTSEQVKSIVSIFEEHGAQAKISSIHVNGWFGEYDKLTTTLRFMQNEFSLSGEDLLSRCAFVGDSPNDEPMFKHFPHSFGVANVKHFAQSMTHKPSYTSRSEGALGFTEIASRIIELNHSL